MHTHQHPQAPQQGHPQFSPQHHQQAAALGIDLSKIDWSKIGSILQFIASVLQQAPPPPTGQQAI